MKKKRTRRRSTTRERVHITSEKRGRSGTRDKRAKSRILRLMSETKVPSETNRDALDGMSNDQLKLSLRRCQAELESYTEAKINMNTLIRDKDKEIKLLRKKNKGTGRQRRSRRVSNPDSDDRVRYSDDSV